MVLNTLAVKSVIKWFLTVRGLHYLLTRFGTTALQRLSFDQKFLDGQWKFAEPPASGLISVVEKYAAGGDVLMLGCGSAAIAQALNPATYATFLGIDLSPAAIAIASRQVNPKTRFEVGDMLAYRCRQPYNVILMSESLYYLNPLRRKGFLRKLAANLTAQGMIVVTISQAARYRKLLDMIRRSFEVAEDEQLQAGGRHLIVFR